MDSTAEGGEEKQEVLPVRRGPRTTPEEKPIPFRPRPVYDFAEKKTPEPSNAVRIFDRRVCSKQENIEFRSFMEGGGH
ncbi:hypothetical protein IL306_007205 [Fusarium sp. DS 682]|nr:hypothetical protein IL306_007205 [Fusarium sp. DS 682]